MLFEKSWRDTIIDNGFYALKKRKKKKKKKVISESDIPDAFGLNKATDFVVPTEEEDKNALDF